MQDTEARRELLARYAGGQPDPLVVMLKCAVGVLALVAVATAPWLFSGSVDGNLATELPASRMTKALPSSIAESRRIYEERRQLHEARSKNNTPVPDSWVAGAEAASGPAGK